MIKVTESKILETSKPFPKLMINTKMKFVILATDKKVSPNKIPGTSPGYVGTVVNKTPYWNIGYYSDSWDGEGFEDYNGPITLENE